MKNIRYCVFILLLSFAAGLSLSAQDLVILHTNDMHSQIEVMRTGKGAGKGGVHRLAEYINQVKQENKNVLLLDAGDYNQGTPYFTLFRGELEIQLMNALGYEVATLGNHEFDNGLEELAKRLSKAHFQTVCANYDFSNTPLKKYVKPYTIIRKGGKKIGIFGLTTNLDNLVAHKNIEGMVFKKDTYKVANDIAEYLKKKKKCDIVIALTHIGYSGHPKSLTDISLAEKTENIDLIIGGHSHTFLKKERVFKNRAGKDVVVVQTGCKSEYVGRFDINFK